MSGSDRDLKILVQWIEHQWMGEVVIQHQVLNLASVAGSDRDSKDPSSMDITSVDGGGGYSEPGFEPGKRVRAVIGMLKRVFHQWVLDLIFLAPSFELGQASSISRIGEGYSSDDSLEVCKESCLLISRVIPLLVQDELLKDDSESTQKMR